MIQELENGRDNHLPTVKAQRILPIVVIIHRTVSPTQSGLDSNTNNIKENQREKIKRPMYSFPTVAVTNYHRSRHRKLHKLTYSCRDQKPKISLTEFRSRRQAGLIPSGGSRRESDPLSFPICRLILLPFLDQ